MKMKKQEPRQKPADDDTPVSAPAESTTVASKNITCSYGIHRGKFPVAGMKGKDARLVLKKLIKVDDSAAMVINGQVFNEDEIISAETTMVSFVKPSAVKGADEVIKLSGDSVDGVGKKFKVDAFCDLLAKNTVSGLHDEPIPDNVKWIVRAGKLEVYILELKPELRRVKWVNATTTKQSAKQDENGYSFRTLATPYVVMSVPFFGGQLQTQLELFYRNGPLAGLDDPLSMCNLLNVSIGKRVDGQVGVKTWVCTQYLKVPAKASRADVLSEIISHVFGGGFNRSSDNNEGASGFSAYEAAKGDRRTRDVNEWEKASQENPSFVLDTKWIDAKCTPRDLIEFRMKQFNVEPAPTSSKAIGNLLLATPEVAF